MNEIRNRSLLYGRGIDRNLPYGFTFSAVQVGLVKEQVMLGLQFFFSEYSGFRQFQWPRGIRLGSAAARLLRLWVVCCECCVCVVRWKSMRGAGRFSKGVLPTVLRRCV